VGAAGARHFHRLRDEGGGAVSDTDETSRQDMVSDTEAIPVTTPYCGYEKAPRTPRRSDVPRYVKNRP
jgi:hypothetical protein